MVDGILSIRYVLTEAIRHSAWLLTHEGHPGLNVFFDNLRKRAGGQDRPKMWQRSWNDVLCWRLRSNHAQDLQPSEIEAVQSRLVVDVMSTEGHTCSHNSPVGFSIPGGDVVGFYYIHRRN